MSHSTAFISFRMEDIWARHALLAHASDSSSAVQFVDYSVHDLFDTSWKDQCKSRIARTKGTIVLIGRNTYLSEAVAWEIKETFDQRHHILGVQIDDRVTHIVPKNLPAQNVIRWDIIQIFSRLSTWV
ncbi:TIR domain-containing protein [Streptomyces nigra]|uniref:TIR domain-containing protein n=1 Tax=Streptomyces nigra TaxID=1827580 RepID=UPI003829F40A